MTDDVLTAPEIAKRLNFSTARIYELAREGVLPHVRVGRSVRFRWSAVEAWLRESERAGEPVR